MRTLVYSNIWIAIGAAAWALQCYWIKDIAPDYLIVLMVFLSTLWVYNLDRLLAYNFFIEGNSARHDWLLKNKYFLQLMTGLPILPIIFLVFNLSLDQVFYGGQLTIIAVLYALRVFKVKGKYYALRDVPLLKILLIAYVWAAATSDFLLVEEWNLLEGPSAMFWERFFFVLAITLPFDIRDMEMDKQHLVKTVATLFGQTSTLVLAIICLIVSAVIAWNIYPESIFMMAFLPTMILAGLAILVTKRFKNADLFFTGGIDALFLLQAILVYLALDI